MLPRWAFGCISICTSATVAYGGGWSLPSAPHFLQLQRNNGSPLYGNPPSQGQVTYARTTTQPHIQKRARYLPSLLNARGGDAAAEDDNDDSITVTASESDGSEEDVDNDKDDGKNAMQELRKKWSDTPAVPSIAWPVTDMMDDISTEGTLGAFDTEPVLQKATPKDGPTKAIIIMDGFCPYHGQYLAHTARHAHGAAVIHVLSDFVTRFLYQVQGQTDHLSSRLTDLNKGEEVEAWSSLLPPSFEICGIYCESDSGLEDAEKLGVALGLYPRCHDGVNVARRDKFLMNQVVSDSGLDVVKQKQCSSLDEVEIFTKELGLGEEEKGETLVVVKPLRGVASDDVHLCSDLPSVRRAFTKIHQSQVFGSSTAEKHEQVLIQEFATGVEYAVDVVCRDGERKAAPVWKYDKRAVNGAPFVYFSTQLVSASEGDVEKEVCNYIFNALDALGCTWGLSHVEVIAEKSPDTGKIRVRLVEVNCRQHNTDFMPLANACVGYNALDMVLAAHLGEWSDDVNTSQELPELLWDSIPALPTTRAFGAIVHFVSHVEGRISNIRYNILEEMSDLSSVVDMHIYPQFLEVGNEIDKTIDIRSDTGWAHIMNDDEEEFRRDYDRLVELEEEMFEVE